MGDILYNSLKLGKGEPAMKFPKKFKTLEMPLGAVPFEKPGD
jgi:hypothetical protein